MFIESMIPSNHLILCHPLLLLPSGFPSIRVFSNKLAVHIKWPKYWIFSFSISLYKEYPGLISFRIDWFDLLALQGTLKSLLQHHSSNAPILQLSAFFIVQLSHPYMTIEKKHSFDYTYYTLTILCWQTDRERGINGHLTRKERSLMNSSPWAGHNEYMSTNVVKHMWWMACRLGCELVMKSKAIYQSMENWKLNGLRSIIL